MPIEATGGETGRGLVMLTRSVLAGNQPWIVVVAKVESGGKEATMPLRDHFRPPVAETHSWDELHGGWPMMIVQHLFPLLPKGFVAAPGVHLGAGFEVDVSAHEKDEPEPMEAEAANGNGGVAVATWAPPKTTLTLTTDVPDQDQYEVRVYNAELHRRLVAAIEIVSPSNKDRPDSRALFVAKIAALLEQDVCVSVVDLVTVRHFNLYSGFLDLIDQSDPMLGEEPPAIYAVTMRWRTRKNKRRSLDAWYYPMQIGQALPTLPIWLDVDKGVMLNLEPGYEETCRLLHIA
jgi:hypothetical protein